MVNEKCASCDINRRVEESEEPACCAWLMENVVCGDKTIDDCTAFEPIKKE